MKLEAVCYGTRRLVQVKGGKWCTQRPQDSVAELEYLCYEEYLCYAAGVVETTGVEWMLHTTFI